MQKALIAELSKACEEFGLTVEIVENNGGLMAVLSGGLPGPEVIHEINRRFSVIGPQITKILLDIPHDETTLGA